MVCPDDEVLAAVADGFASPEERARVEAHIDTCADCRALVADAVRLAMRDQDAEPRHTATPDLAPRGDADRYEVSLELGRGGMGRVYRAFDPQLRRDVALKVLAPQTVADETRLLREAQTLARLSHPHVVQVFDVGRSDHGVFIAMELIRGPTLRQWLTRGERNDDEIVQRFVEAGRGLAAAHALGLVHRDFKPSNVMIGDEDGRARVLDFGLARELEAASTSQLEPTRARSRGSATSAGMASGTPRYMAPEQLAGAHLDARADQYAFCVALFEALCGAPPFSGTLVEQRAAKQRGEVAFPARAAVPRWLRGLILRGLAPQPDARWPSMEVLVSRLQRGDATGRRMVGWSSLAVLALGLGSWAIVQPPEAAGCVADSAGWTAEQRVRMATVLARPDVPEPVRVAIVEHLDHYAQAWGQARDDACEAGAQAELQRMCLDRARVQLQTMLDAAAQPQTTVEGIAEAVFGLPSVATCARVQTHDAMAPSPSEQTAAAAVAKLRGELARARVFERLGRYEASRQVLDSIADAVAATQWEPLTVEVGLLRAWLDEREGEYESAASRLATVSLDARAAGHDEIAAQAALRRAFVVSTRLGRPEEGALALRDAEALVRRAGGRDELQATYLRSLATVQRSRGDYEAAAASFERELQLLERAMGSEHRLRAVALSNLGGVYTRLGRYDEAREALEGSRDLFTRLVGPEHMFVAFPLNQLGVLEDALGHPGRALRHVETAFAINRAQRGESHPIVMGMLNNVGAMAYRAGDLEAARRHFERVVELHETHAPGHPNIARARGNLALIAKKEGRLDEARAWWERALTDLEVALGTQHPDLVPTLANLGELYVDLGEVERGADILERAVALETAAKGAEHPDVVKRRDMLQRARRAPAEPED